jgi:hypothetical protein
LALTSEVSNQVLSGGLETFLMILSGFGLVLGILFFIIDLVDRRNFKRKMMREYPEAKHLWKNW